MYPSNPVTAYKNESGVIARRMYDVMYHHTSMGKRPKKVAAFLNPDGTVTESAMDCRRANYDYKVTKFIRSAKRALPVAARTKAVLKTIEEVAAAKYAHILTGKNVNTIFSERA